jgi:hypothetical protein
MEKPVSLLLIQKTFNTGPINCNILSNFNMSHVHIKKMSFLKYSKKIKRDRLRYGNKNIPHLCNELIMISMVTALLSFDDLISGQFPPNLDNGRSPHEYINQRLQIQFGAPDDERYAARNMLSLQ